ncbi:type III secretion system cytoplasmic ring protein SctQ [Trinickia fusca]|uniref:YscQ/HrcQ family type III secretion apparatus protein n=1 Tax=Trinickia fusca TaxID=2419777 RepID=A0A494XIN3_9BURK|nr:type III secretion system cytoplasmic ring protein SctQ [Trinickia fusca]RKP50605.1 YscQ/HrcQ family type III secretion apparatus protein [Trinickia fusca]
MSANPAPSPRTTAPPTAAGVQPLTASTALPRISALAAQALNRAYAWTAPFALELARGRYELHWQADAEVSAPARAYTFRFGPAEGKLVIDAIGERELIGEAASDTVPAPIRCALMADALTPVFAALEGATRQRVEFGSGDQAGKDDISRERDALRFCVTRPGTNWRCHGALRFHEERFLGLACPQEPQAPALGEHDFDDLPITLRFSIGSTTLSVGELHDIERGDIISIQRWQSIGKTLRVTATTLDRRIALTGKIMGARVIIDYIEENSVPPPSSSDPTAANASSLSAPPPTTPPAAPGETGTALTQLDALEVRVTFELDERSMPLRELKAIKSGYVLELDQPLNQSTVHIRANGALVGHGHLIAVGNRLGVRVVRFSEGNDG